MQFAEAWKWGANAALWMAERRNAQALRWRLLAERYRDRLSTARGFDTAHRPIEQPQAHEPHPDQWERISVPAWRSLKRSIVSAAQAGAISGPTAERLIARFRLK